MENQDNLPIEVIRRQQILAKEFISLKEFTELIGLPYPTAQKIMAKIKFKSEREVPKGYIHVQDYMDYYHLPPERYFGVRLPKGETANA